MDVDAFGSVLLTRCSVLSILMLCTIVISCQLLVFCVLC